MPKTTMRIRKVQEINCPHFAAMPDVEGFEPHEQGFVKAQNSEGVSITLSEDNENICYLNLCPTCHDRVFAQLYQGQLEKTVVETITRAMKKAMKYG